MMLVGKVLVTGTLAVFSWSSTLLLHGVSSPYIIKLDEITSTSETNLSVEKREFEATRMNIFGMKQTTRFRLEDIKKEKTSHPFANFIVNDRWYFITPDYITDPKIREYFELQSWMRLGDSTIQK